MQFIDFQGKKVAYYTNGGKGAPIVFIHGFCMDSSIWEDFSEPFEDDYQIIRIDLPGFGNSESVADSSLKGMAERIIAVLEHLKVDKFILIGHSMGGYVSLEVAKAKAGQLLGLGLFHSHPYADSDEKKEERDKALEFIERNGHELFVKQFIPNLFATDFAKSHTFLVDKMILRASRFPQTGLTTALKAMKSRNDNAKVLEESQYPVLFIIGEMDTAIPFETSMKQTHLPSIGDIHVLPRVGHMGMFKAKKETQSIIRKFAHFCQNR